MFYMKMISNDVSLKLFPFDNINLCHKKRDKIIQKNYNLDFIGLNFSSFDTKRHPVKYYFTLNCKNDKSKKTTPGQRTSRFQDAPFKLSNWLKICTYVLWFMVFNIQNGALCRNLNFLWFFGLLSRFFTRVGREVPVKQYFQHNTMFTVREQSIVTGC